MWIRSHTFSLRRTAIRYGALTTIGLTLAAVSCKGDDSSRDAPKLGVNEPEPQGYLVGVRPEAFACESLFTIETATELFGGRVEQVESPFTPPAGVPGSCNFVSYAEGRQPLHWSFDLDCREGAHDDAGQLMVNYADAPGAKPMRIGLSALDHNGSALLFIDDDTPCYGRVLGPDQAIRVRIAEILVPVLDARSAPTGTQFVLRE
ncbi:MAG: hypothetical protein GY811_03100 [Myxococcales bacterium]|nr:hypothetical protein [Myxococcales bacterium]